MSFDMKQQQFTLTGNPYEAALKINAEKFTCEIWKQNLSSLWN